MLPQKHRLNLRFHRNRLNEQGQVRHSRHFIIISAISQNPQQNSRFAILISKKLLRKAVDRNRLKRQVSEIIRVNIKKLPKNKDILLIPKKSIRGLDYANIKTNLLQALK